MTNPRTEPECCPPFEPNTWDDITHEWNEKPFIKGKVCTIWYMPLNFGKVMRRMNALVEKSAANIPDWLCLSEHTSSWKMNLLLAVDKQVEGIENLTLSGKFLTKVYEGAFKDTPKWSRDFSAFAKNAGHTIDKPFMWYTTCPKCARKYGKNYVVLVGRIL